MTSPSRSNDSNAPNLPLEIEESLLRLLAIEDELNERRAAAKRIELRITLELTAAKDDKGKLILSNDKQREAAVAEYLGQDEAFLKLYGETKRLERESSEVKAALERLRIEVKYDLLARESDRIDRSIRLVEAIWQARQESTRVMPRVAIEADPIGTPEFFRTELRVIPDSEADGEDDVCPF